VEKGLVKSKCLTIIVGIRSIDLIWKDADLHMGVYNKKLFNIIITLIKKIFEFKNKNNIKKFYKIFR